MKKKLYLVLFAAAVILNIPTCITRAADSLSIKSGAIKKDSLIIVKKDSTMQKDSTAAKVRRDTLKPVNQISLSNASDFINKDFFDMNDYLYAGDILKNLGYNYTRNYGFYGQPNENFIFGSGFNSVSYFEDGILLNNRFRNSFDLNNVQSEYIDSVEAVPLPRGFLYGNVNNPAAINFITKDFLSPVPYTRIKYYQGPNGEAMIDGIYNQNIFKKFKLSVDITNRKLDSSYTNSAYSQWIVRANLKYYLSGNWNLIGSYRFDKSLVGINGGVNVDSISSLTTDINSLLYDEIRAPVYFPSQSQGLKEHFFSLKALGSYDKKVFTSLTVYYDYNEGELNNYVDTIFFKNVDKERLFGISLNQKVEYDFLQLQLLGNFESGNLKYYSLSNSYFNYYPVSYKSFSVSPAASLYLLDSSLVPSIFLKYSNDDFTGSYSNSGGYTGIGSDLTYHYSSVVKFYIGASKFKTGPNQNFAGTYEIGTKIILPNLNADLKLFNKENYSPFEKYNFINYDDKYSANLTGVSADIKFVIKPVALETHAYYYSNQSGTLFYQFPQLNLTGGLYYENILFKSNLNLKTGFAFDFTGKRMEAGFGNIGPNFKLDFTLAGEIQKRAIVYFTWENLLNAQYYLVPYYPMRARNIRFGISWELFD